MYIYVSRVLFSFTFSVTDVWFCGMARTIRHSDVHLRKSLFRESRLNFLYVLLFASPSVIAGD